MSIKVVTPTVRDPRFFNSTILGGYTGEDPDIFEAPPHITTLRLKVTLSGGHSYTDSLGYLLTETLDYTKEVTLSRVEIPRVWDEWTTYPDIPDMTGVYGADRGEPYVAMDAPAPGNFLAITQGTFGKDMEIAKRGLLLIYDTAYEPEVCGTYEYYRSTPGSSYLSGDMLLGTLPSLRFWDRASEREPNRKFSAEASIPSFFYSPGPSTLDFDVSAWTVSEWRSKLQVYSASFAEETWAGGAGDSFTDVVIEVEWELS